MGIFGRDSIIGIDIGASSVKMAQVTKKGDSLQLVRGAVKEFKGPFGKEPDEKEILDSLKGLLRGVDIKRSIFTVAINCPRTCVRTLVAPAMPKSELGEAVRLTAKDYFPFPIDEASLDFEIMGEFFEKGVKRERLLVATSPRSTIDRYMTILKKAGVRPFSLVPAPMAMRGVIERLRPAEGVIRAILDIGAHFTELIIFSDKSLVFSRKIPVAGDDITKAMTGVLVSDRGKTALTPEEAERLKRDIGIPSENDSSIIQNKISATQILSMIRPFIEQLAAEIERCFAYYREETGGAVSSLIIFGGGAYLKGLLEYLSTELGIEVKIGDTLEDLRLAQAAGAALSAGKGMNLLPAEVKDKIRNTFKRAVITAVSTALIFTLFIIYIGMKIQLDIFRRRIDVAKREYSSLLPQLNLAQTQVMANRLLANGPYWEDLFLEISNIMPDEIYLTELGMKDNAVLLKGVVEAKANMEILSDFILSLEKGISKDAKLITTRDKKDGTNIFEIKCRMD